MSTFLQFGYPIVLVVQVLSALAIIGLVLVQHGKGADMGAAFGSGSSGSLFGATGAANALSAATKWCAVAFFVATLTLGIFASKRDTTQSGGVMDSYKSAASAVAPKSAASAVSAPAASVVVTPAGASAVPAAAASGNKASQIPN